MLLSPEGSRLGGRPSTSTDSDAGSYSSSRTSKSHGSPKSRARRPVHTHRNASTKQSTDKIFVRMCDGDTSARIPPLIIGLMADCHCAKEQRQRAEKTWWVTWRVMASPHTQVCGVGIGGRYTRAGTMQPGRHFNMHHIIAPPRSAGPPTPTTLVKFTARATTWSVTARVLSFGA